MNQVVVIGLVLGLVTGCAAERDPVECTSCADRGVHPSGWNDVRTADFHGAELARRGWDFELCATCHGTDLRGKATAPSCFGCHPQGPTACDTCHGNPPATGAHFAHVTQGLACDECHMTPATWDAPGHILDENRQPITGPAKVTFGALANQDLVPPRRTGPATWDAVTARCSNVWCHGGAFGDTSAGNTQPRWYNGSGKTECGTCHGAPPSDHARAECTTCHPRSYAGGQLVAPHVDGAISVGDGSSTCSGCHGDPQSPAPPRGLHGELSSTDLVVGAHRVHLSGSTIRGPIACSECHLVPAEVTSAGHLDSLAPAEVTFGALASTDAVGPRAWDRTTGTCTNVYCHGAGARLVAEPSPDKVATPRWTATAAQTTFCGACHGLPPSDADHTPAMQLTDCATCHPQSVGPFGNILVANGRHINGQQDVQ